MKKINSYYLPSGRIFVADLSGYRIEFTEMRDVKIKDKKCIDVRNTQDPKIIWKHLDDYKNKWLLTVSTQKGCLYNCRFCDVAPLKFRGNLSKRQIIEQVKKILEFTPYVTQSNKVKIGFARMGEPAANLSNVIQAICDLPMISRELRRNFKWLPCFNSILPKKYALETIREVVKVKEIMFSGLLHFQISVNSTDEKIRKYLFGNADVMPLPKIISEIDKYNISNRTITLNFIVMDGIPIDIKFLKSLGIDKSRFTIKLIPLNNTLRGNDNNLKTYANYSNYEKLEELGAKFRDNDLHVVVDGIARCEEAGLCCGQLIK